MLVAYQNAHVTSPIAWIDVHVIKTATVDVHVRTRLNIVVIRVTQPMKTTINNAEINNEFNSCSVKKIADFSIQLVNTNALKATKKIWPTVRAVKNVQMDVHVQAAHHTIAQFQLRVPLQQYPLLQLHQMLTLPLVKSILLAQH